jgi:hypothetical protein
MLDCSRMEKIAVVAGGCVMSEECNDNGKEEFE